jgi:GNAT superfamily N-acetyltransferase/RimJ/RimL family protein N-acetyltransferase
MHIERVARGDGDLIRSCHDILLAARKADNPEGPTMSLPVFKAMISSGWTGDPRETWLVPDGTGFVQLELPERDNPHMARLELIVRPDQRRQGAGTALLGHATARARAAARTLLTASAWVGSAGEAFARSEGFSPGITEVRRVLKVGAVPPLTVADGYSLVSWTGQTPAGYVKQVAALQAMLSDAPSDPSWEPEQWDGERVRLADQRVLAQGVRYYSVAAVRGASGELVALSQLGVDPLQPEWGLQELTAVARAHRGHRLGMTVKVAMLDLLSRDEPQIQRIATWNAAANKHMIAINEALGFEVTGKPARSWEREI